MFEYLKGELVSRKPARVVIDVGGVGYELFVPTSTSERLPAAGSLAKLLVHMHQRDEAPKLFGFGTHAERSLFRSLIGVSGVGPSVAIQILSRVTINRFFQAITAGDEKFLSTIKGIGKKTAQRLIVELSGKLPRTQVGATLGPGEVAEDDVSADARVALETLGLKPDQADRAIQRALKELPEPPENANDLVRAALRHA